MNCDCRVGNLAAMGQEFSRVSSASDLGLLLDSVDSFVWDVGRIAGLGFACSPAKASLPSLKLLTHSWQVVVVAGLAVSDLLSRGVMWW